MLQGLLLHASEPDTDPPTPPLIARVLATVRSAPSAQRVRQKLQSVLPPPLPQGSNASKRHPEVTVLLQEENARAVRESDVVLLGCRSNAFRDVLGEPDVRAAFREHGRGGKKKKVLVSLLGGVTVAQLRRSLDGSNDDATGPSAGRVPQQEEEEEPYEIIRAIPNIPARVRQSMTVISLPPSTSESTALTHSADANTTTPLPPTHSLILNLFSHLGATDFLPEALIDNGACLCASTPALFATLIEAIATSDGALAIDTYDGGRTSPPGPSTALRMAAYAARGTAELLLAGQQSPEEIRNEVATAGGATRRGLDKLDRMEVVDALRESMAEIFAAAGTLGQRE